MKYIVTVLDPAKEPPAVAILYCGRYWDRACNAVTRVAISRFRGKGFMLRVLTSRDDGTVESSHDTPI